MNIIIGNKADIIIIILLTIILWQYFVIQVKNDANDYLRDLTKGKDIREILDIKDVDNSNKNTEQLDKVFYFKKSYLQLTLFPSNIGLGLSFSKSGVSLLLLIGYIGFHFRNN